MNILEFVSLLKIRISQKTGKRIDEIWVKLVEVVYKFRTLEKPSRAFHVKLFLS